MANIDNLIPHILKWEAGVTRKEGEALDDLFERARKTGYSEDRDDPGGITMCGITLYTFRTHCPKAKKEALKNITFEQWRDILRADYWDAWDADNIDSRSVANMLVDWVWHSGRKYGIGIPQSLLGVDVDYIVGDKTLAAVNRQPAAAFFSLLKNERKAFLTRIAKGAKKKYLNGWLQRVADINFND